QALEVERVVAVEDDGLAVRPLPDLRRRLGADVARAHPALEDPLLREDVDAAVLLDLAIEQRRLARHPSDVRLIGAVDAAAALEPAVRDDPVDARRRAGPERRVSGPGLGVQVRVARLGLHLPVREEAGEA